MAATCTKTYAIMDAWAERPADVEVPCAVCAKDIPVNEVYYYVTQLDRDESGREQPVCWRHIHPDRGPR